MKDIQNFPFCIYNPNPQLSPNPQLNPDIKPNPSLKPNTNANFNLPPRLFVFLV